MDCSCDGLDLDVAVFNNFFEDKASELSMTDEEYRYHMGAIFRNLSNPKRQRAIINTDSASASPCPCTTFSMLQISKSTLPVSCSFLPIAWNMPR